MNPDYIIIITLVSVVAFIATVLIFETYSTAPKVVASSFLAVALLSFAVGFIVPMRVKETVPANLHITRGDNVVLIQGEIDGEKIIQTNHTAFFYNNADKPGYKIVYRTRSTAYHILVSADFILVKETP